MAVLIVVPLTKPPGPLPGGVAIGKSAGGEVGPVFGGAEQRLGEGIVVADPRARIGRLDAQPVQHRQHRRRLQRGAVVAVQHRLVGPAMHAFGQGGAPRQVCRMLGAVGVMHLEADDLATVEVDDQIQIKPHALHAGRQERDVPAPHRAGTGRRRRA